MALLSKGLLVPSARCTSLDPGAVGPSDHQSTGWWLDDDWNDWISMAEFDGNWATLHESKQFQTCETFQWKVMKSCRPADQWADQHSAPDQKMVPAMTASKLAWRCHCPRSQPMRTTVQWRERNFETIGRWLWKPLGDKQNTVRLVVCNLNHVAVRILLWYVYVMYFAKSSVPLSDTPH